MEVWLEHCGQRSALSSQHYLPDVIHPDGRSRIAGFHCEPWPTWRFRIGEIEITQELLAIHERSETLIRWSAARSGDYLKLFVRPLISGRDYHALHRENPSFCFDADAVDSSIVWRPYGGLPAIQALSNGRYRHSPDWYRNFLYFEERRRGLDCVEDLASPGEFSWDLARAPAVLIFRAVPAHEPPLSLSDVLGYADQAQAGELGRRRSFPTAADRAADAYIVRRGSGKTIVAGYPWFTDWGRDTFIALRGLCIARGDLGTARDILVEWAGAVSEGMLPNRFPDAGEAPEYNSVDASLWYVVAVHDYLAAVLRSGERVYSEEIRKLRVACEKIVAGYAAGTRFGIVMDADGLLAAGIPGLQLTWMDAKIGDWVVTPRIGKPVEIQALWLNALRIVSAWRPEWRDGFDRGVDTFRRRFWRADARCLFDVVDVDHVAGRMDASFRPNQIFAVGGLPFALLGADQAKAVVDSVEARLLTPMGLRSLAPEEPGYRPRYGGSVLERDSAYHQGTVWPWFVGPFVEAWIRVRGGTAETRKEADRRFLEPLRDHLRTAGLSHVSEVASADPPHEPGGCPFQAWSLAELIRVTKLIELPQPKPRVQNGPGLVGRRLRDPVATI
jgi:predicted glycogen debranching enzyme